MKLLDLMTGPWAMLPEQLSELQHIYAMHLRGEQIDIAAVEARLGRPLSNQQQTYTIADGGVAVLPITGVLAPKANLFMQVSGGSSTQMLMQQVQSMRADPRVRSAVIRADSPGGSVLGTPALAATVHQLAGEKPTVTVGEGTMASAMYWIGSGANAMFVEGVTDQVGSIGVVQRMTWDKPGANTLEMTRGRYKRISVNGAPPSADIVAYHESQLDHLYAVFVDAVAQHRGTDSATVLDRMADGRVFIGQQAIDAGLVDGFSTVDAMVEQMATDPGRFARRKTARIKPLAAASASPAPAAVASLTPLTTTTERPPMSENQGAAPQPPVTAETIQREHPQVHAAIYAAGALAERDRVASVRAQSLPGHEALIDTMVADGRTTGAQAAMAVLAAERNSISAAAAAHAADAPAPAKSSAAPSDAPAKTKQQQVDEAKAYAAANGVEFVAAMKALGFAA